MPAGPYHPWAALAPSWSDKKGLISFTTFFLLFFYGVMLSVGGLGFIGYLGMVSQAMYIDIDPTFANITVGFL